MDLNFAINDITNYLAKNGISKISSVVINSMTFRRSHGAPIIEQVNSGNLLNSYNYTSLNSDFFTYSANIDDLDWNNGVTISILLTITTTANQTYNIIIAKTVNGDQGGLDPNGGDR